MAGDSGSMISTLSIIIAVVCFILGGCIATMNWYSIYASYRERRFISAAPLFGGLLLGIGFLLLPQTRRYFWTAIFLDWGMLVVFIALPRMISEFWRTSRTNLLEEYTGQYGNRTVRLCLFRKAIFVLEQEIMRVKGECGIKCGVTGISQIGAWRREDNRLLLTIGGETTVFEFAADSPEIIRQTGEPASCKESAELSLAGSELTRIK